MPDRLGLLASSFILLEVTLVTLLCTPYTKASFNYLQLIVITPHLTS